MPLVTCFIGILLLGAVLTEESLGAVMRSRYDPLPMHLRRLHHRSAMYRDYLQPDMYVPSMTTLTVGDTFTGYLDPIETQPPLENTPCQTCDTPAPTTPPELEESTRGHRNEIEQPVDKETEAETTTQYPDIKEGSTQKTKTKIAPKIPTQEEDDYEDWPFVKHDGRKMPPYNVFFPMMFVYPGQGRSGENGGYPGGATAIANSFSSGKGGVASSHATVFGRAPYTNENKYGKRRSQGDDY